MANLKTGVVRRGLERKGFVKDEKNKRRDHERFFYVTHGANPRKTNVFTYISRQSSGVDIRDKVLSSMARECRLETSEFLDLVSCEDKKCGAYDVVLARKGITFPASEPDGTPVCRDAIPSCRIDGEAKT